MQPRSEWIPCTEAVAWALFHRLMFAQFWMCQIDQNLKINKTVALSILSVYI